MRRSLPSAFFIIILSLFSNHLSGQQEPYFQYLDHPWVDSVLLGLSPEERMAQTLWIATSPHKDLSHYVRLDQLVREHGLGGLILSGPADHRQSELIHYYRSVSRHPLGIASEGEWNEEYPGQMALRAITSASLLQRLGCSLGQHYKGLGVEILLAPGMGESILAGLQEHHMMAVDPKDTSGLAGCFRRIELKDEMDFSHIKTLIYQGKTDAESITNKTREVLAFKYWSGLKQEKPAVVQEGMAFTRKIYEHALTLLNNEDQLIPIRDLEKKRIASVAINACSLNAFQEMAGNYTRIDHFSWHPGTEAQDSLLEVLGSYDVVLAAVYPSGDLSGTPQGMDNFLSELAGKAHLISTWFGEPEALIRMDGLRSSAGLILAYEPCMWTEELAPQLIFGGIGSRGSLPVDVAHYAKGTGIRTAGELRLQYGYPENAGISSGILKHTIDSIVLGGLKAGAYPGCEVIVARKGMVVFHKTYGYHTYDARIGVQKKDLYDLASVTKVSGPLSGLMWLESRGKFSHDDRLGDYILSMKGSDKADLELSDILSHQAGLYPWIPYWERTVKKNGHYKRRYIRTTASDEFSLPVADRVYLKSDYRKRIYREIRKSELGEKKYLYSGLSFILFPEMIENLSGESYESFLSTRIYRKLGAWDLVFRPHRFYPLSQIVPTEYDSLFRNQLVHGYVHDEGAAMMVGYSGNAGLFSTANDLLKLFEMYRRMGNYGGEQIIAKEVLQNYSSYQFPDEKNRRGLGFDKPLLNEHDGTKDDYPCPGASPSSFGHSGFTGTFAWTDPEHEITYVFLSNRVYPTRNNRLLYEMDIRTGILQGIYDSIMEP
ncbi:MAG: serine hydrolase domain-containing protein [Bacteroidota bacterium]